MFVNIFNSSMGVRKYYFLIKLFSHFIQPGVFSVLTFNIRPYHVILKMRFQSSFDLFYDVFPRYTKFGLQYSEK